MWGWRRERARDEGRHREQECAKGRERPSGGRSEPCPTVLCLSSVRQSYQTPKGFCSCVCFALTAVFEVINPGSDSNFCCEIIDSALKALILFAKQLILMDSFRRFTHAIFVLAVYLCEAQVADRSEGICWVDHRLHCIAAHTWRNFNVLAGTKVNFPNL